MQISLTLFQLTFFFLHAYKCMFFHISLSLSFFKVTELNANRKPDLLKLEEWRLLYSSSRLMPMDLEWVVQQSNQRVWDIESKGCLMFNLSKRLGLWHDHSWCVSSLPLPAIVGGFRVKLQAGSCRYAAVFFWSDSTLTCGFNDQMTTYFWPCSVSFL